MKSIYESPVFEISNAQYERACEWLGVPQDARERTRLPKRALVVQVPVRMGDGSVKSFEGSRVQHHLALGPTKGGVRFHPEVIGWIHAQSGRPLLVGTAKTGCL